MVFLDKNKFGFLLRFLKKVVQCEILLGRQGGFLHVNREACIYECVILWGRK